VSENKNDLVFILDSFAILAYLTAEAGSNQVLQILKQAIQGHARGMLCSINFGEILYIVERQRGLARAQQVQALVESLPISIIDPSRELVLEAAHIKAHRAISHADAFVVALALRERATIITGDPEFSCVKDLVTVEWLISPPLDAG
jgi:ribonuclease VapC